MRHALQDLPKGHSVVRMTDLMTGLEESTTMPQSDLLFFDDSLHAIPLLHSLFVEYLRESNAESQMVLPLFPSSAFPGSYMLTHFLEGCGS